MHSVRGRQGIQEQVLLPGGEAGDAARAAAAGSGSGPGGAAAGRGTQAPGGGPGSGRGGEAAAAGHGAAPGHPSSSAAARAQPGAGRPGTAPAQPGPEGLGAGGALGVLAPLDRLVLAQLVAVVQLVTQAVPGGQARGQRQARHGRAHGAPPDPVWRMLG